MFAGLWKTNVLLNNSSLTWSFMLQCAYEVHTVNNKRSASINGSLTIILEPFTSCKLQWKPWLNSCFQLRSTCDTIWWDFPRNLTSMFHSTFQKTGFLPAINFTVHFRKDNVCIRDLDITLDKEARWLFLSPFWPLLKWAIFFEAAGAEVASIGSSLKSDL